MDKSSGELFSLGSNGSGQLGIGHLEDVSRATKCQLFQSNHHNLISKPTQIATGGNHTIVLGEDGRLLAAGLPQDGRCIVGAQSESADEETAASHFRLQQLPTGELPAIRLCCATWEATILVAVDCKTVYSCGTGHRGELGLGVGISSAKFPTEIKFVPPLKAPIRQVASGMSHVVVILANGDVYGWGSGRKGQLGTSREVLWSPTKILDVDFKPEMVTCGKDFTYFVGSADDGRHVVLGLDKWNVRSSAPETIKGRKSIGASWGSIFVLFEDGTLIGWGRNDHGQLPPNKLPPILDFAAGSEHVVAKSTNGHLLVWGWGEHGNCGQSIDENGDVSGVWNEVGLDGEVGFLAAGCATTWAYIRKS